MKRILTALGDPLINNKLIKEKEFEIISKDIQYQDGIFEILENNKEIDYIILSENLLGENKIEILIDKIKEKNNKIKIIIILEKIKEELENDLLKKGIIKIYYYNKLKIEEIINFIKEKNKINNNIENEFKNLKEILNNNNLYLEKEINKKNILKNENNKINNKIELLKKENTKIKKEIISITGTGGVGKSIITLNLANIIKQKQRKILILDFDILNSSLHTILGVNKYPQKIKNILQKNNLIQNKLNIKDLIIKINKKVDLISGINLLFDNKYKISSEKIKFILEELKQYYDTIIIDNSSECFFDYTKNILNNSDIILFVLESNLLEIKKANNLLKIYKEEWNIEDKKINIIINKYNENAVDDKVIENIFSNYKLLGKIKFNKKYNILINKNFEENIFTKNIKKDYIKITDKIIKLKINKINLILENLYNRIKFNIYQKNNS